MTSKQLKPELELEHQTKTARVLNKIIIGFLVLTAMVIGLLLSWALTKEDPLVVNNSPFPTRSVRPNAEANGVIILTVDFCKNTDKSGEVRTSFVSQTREVFLPLAKEHMEKGCRKEELPVLIPKDLPADNYKLKFVARYNLNPLKTAVPITFESQEFHVNPLGTDAQLITPKK